MKNEKTAQDLEEWLVGEILGVEKPVDTFSRYIRGTHYQTNFPHTRNVGIKRYLHMAHGPLILFTDKFGPAIYLKRRRKDYRGTLRSVRWDELA